MKGYVWAASALCLLSRLVRCQSGTGTLAITNAFHRSCLLCYRRVLYLYFNNSHCCTVFTNKPAILSVYIDKNLITVNLQPGDAVGFVAAEYLHKLERDPSDTSGGKFLCFTAWTEATTVDRVETFVEAQNHFVVE